jgi:hypothetical protein
MNMEDGDGNEVSLIGLPPRKGPVQFRGHVVAELQDNDNRPIIQVSGGSLVELVVIHDIIGRMLAKSVVQPNIRRIYDELLGYVDVVMCVVLTIDTCKCSLYLSFSLFFCISIPQVN